VTKPWFLWVAFVVGVMVFSLGLSDSQPWYALGLVIVGFFVGLSALLLLIWKLLDL
jgi:F0F1-type ATP synthase assembly protein I